MARYQYRVAGQLDWMSSSGNALVVVQNPAGSGKKLTLRSVEVTNLSAVGTHANYSLYRATVSGGDAITPADMDTDASWPSGVRVVTGAALSSPGVALRRITGNKQLVPGSGLSWLAMQRPNRFGVPFSAARRASAPTVEGLVVRAGEAIALKPDTQVAYRPTPIRVSVTVVVLGSPNRTFTATYYAQNTAQNDQVPFAVVNDSGSGQTLVVREFAVEEVGTYDTPYLQVVPVGQIDPTSQADPLSRVPLMKMDSASPDPSSWVKVYKNAPLLPFGLPAQALSDASAGSPKGVNYLQTKDLLGPVYRAAFPEWTATVGLDSVGSAVSHQLADMFGRRASITIREGEAVAIVSAAESATGTTAIPMSGWMALEFGLQIDVEPRLAPTLSVTGLQNPTEVRVFDAGTTTNVAGQENVTTGTFSWVFDPEEHPAVDISILSLGYQNIRLLNVPLSLADITIPIQQIVDRQYANT